MLKTLSHSYQTLGQRELVEEIEVEKTILFIFKRKFTYRRIHGEIFLLKKNNKYMIDTYPFLIKEQEIRDLYKKYFVH